MAFPTAPVDGQTYTGSTGLFYVYRAIDKTWRPRYTPVSKDNTTATANPTATDDTALGYVIGSTWYNTTTDEVFICTSNIAGAATWKPSVQHSKASTLPPTVTDDIVAGYTFGATWYDINTGTTYICENPATGAAVWRQTGHTPSYAIAQLPLLSIIPAIAAPITWPLPTLKNIAHALGTLTVTHAGVYEVSYVAFHEATNKRFGYYVQLVHNLIADLVQGATFTDRNAASTKWSRIVTYKRTLLLAAGDTLALNHFTDDALSTVSGNLSIRRVA